MSGYGKNRLVDLTEMTNLATPTRTLLDEHFCINHVEISDEQKSKGRTIKSAFKLSDNKTVEGVLIPTKSKDDSLYFFAGWL